MLGKLEETEPDWFEPNIGPCASQRKLDRRSTSSKVKVAATSHKPQTYQKKNKSLIETQRGTTRAMSTRYVWQRHEHGKSRMHSVCWSAVVFPSSTECGHVSPYWGLLSQCCATWHHFSLLLQKVESLRD